MRPVDTNLPATRAELIEALHHARATAGRASQIVGSDTLPTPWDRAHHTIDDLLDQLIGR